VQVKAYDTLFEQTSGNLYVGEQKKTSNKYKFSFVHKYNAAVVNLSDRKQINNR
jgi:hypothetical protein